MAPDFTLETLEGSTVRLSELLGGQPVVLLFWSYFCFPCQKEVPDIDALYRELGAEKVRLIGISLDGPQYDGKVRPFLAEKGISFPNAYDRETEQFFEVAERYGVVGTPTLFVVDPQGRVRFIHLGRVEGPILSGIIDGARDQTFCPEIVKPSAGR